MSFFMSQTSAGTAAGADDLALSWAVGNETEQDCRRDTRDELGDDVHGPLRPVELATHDLLDDHRAGGARRVDRGAGGRGDRDDRGKTTMPMARPAQPGAALR